MAWRQQGLTRKAAPVGLDNGQAEGCGPLNGLVLAGDDRGAVCKPAHDVLRAAEHVQQAVQRHLRGRRRV